MLHGNTLWQATKNLIVQSTEKRLICLKMQVMQTTRTTALTTQTTRAATALTARTEATTQATVAKILTIALMQTTKVLTALILQDRANNY